MHHAICHRNKKSLQTISEICIAIGQLYAANGLYYGLYRRKRSRKNNRHEVHAALSTSRQRNGSAARTGCHKGKCSVETANRGGTGYGKLSTKFHHAGCASDVETGLFQMGRGTISTVSGTISLAGKEKVQGIFHGHEEKVSCGSCSCPSSKAFDFG